MDIQRFGWTLCINVWFRWCLFFILCWHISGTMMWRCMWLWRTPKEPQCCSLGSFSCSCRTWTSSPTTSASPWSCTITMTVSVLDQFCWNSSESEWTHLPLLFSHPSGLPTPGIQGGWMWQPLVWGHCSALQGGRGTDGFSYLENPRVSRRRSAEEAAGGKTFEWGDTGFPERSSVKQKQRSRTINPRYRFIVDEKKQRIDAVCCYLLPFLLNLDNRVFVRKHAMMRSCLLKMVHFSWQHWNKNKMPNQFSPLHKGDARISPSLCQPTEVVQVTGSPWWNMPKSRIA